VLTLLEDLAARGMEMLFTSDREQSLTSVIGTTIDTLESCAMSKAIATFLSLKKQVTNLATNTRTAMRSDARLSEAPTTLGFGGSSAPASIRRSGTRERNSGSSP